MNLLQTRPVARTNHIRVYLNTARLAPAPIAIDIGLDPAVRQNLIIAELLALRYALSELALAGADRLHGRGLRLEVSHGAIRKLVRQDSAYQALAPYAQFLQTRYLGAEIEVNKDPYPWAGDDAVQHVHPIGCDPIAEQIPSPFGTLVPTAHLLERMVERAMCSGLDRAMSVLVNQIGSKETRKLDWNDKAAARCRDRYGKHSEVLHHPSSQNLFVVVQEATGERRLVTAYKVIQTEYSFKAAAA